MRPVKVNHFTIPNLKLHRKLLGVYNNGIEMYLSKHTPMVK